MLRRVLRIHDQLVPDEGKRWLIFAGLGSFLVALMDMAGVALTLPLMLIATEAPGSERVLALLAPVAQDSTGRAIVILAAVVGTLFIVKSITAIAIRRWQLGKQNRLGALAAAGLLSLFTASPYAVHRTRDMANTQRHLNFSINQTFGTMLGGFLTVSVDGLTLLLTIVVLTIVSPLGVTTAIVVFGSCIFATQHFTRKRARAIGVEMSDQEHIAWSALLPSLDGFRDVRLSGSREHFIARFRTARSAYGDAVRDLSIMTELPKYVLEIALILGIGSIAAVVSIVGDPSMTVAVLGVFAAAAARLSPTMNRLAFTLTAMRTASVSVEALEDLLPTLQPVRPAPGQSDDVPIPRGDIELQNVGFRYDDATEWSVQGVTCRIPFGTSIAFAGSSGAGKSTLLDIILTLFEPSEGTVTVDGVDIHAFPDAWLRTIGVVSQDVYLLNGTVLQNVAFGSSEDEIDEERAIQALKDAQVSDLLDELPQGAHTMLGERGVRVSGGQRQRIGIARALYRQPSVLVLDEATSALDNKTESLITETMQALSGQLTVVIVAHRLSTIRHVDQLIYLSNGTVEASGTFAEVAEKSRAFRELVELGKLG